jgi:Cdc6-like AAA superfamily ATPase
MISKINKDRIKTLFADNWVNHPKAVEVIKAMNFLVDYPRNFRMPNLLIIGDSNVGKTLTANRFTQQHPGYLYEEEESGLGMIEKLCRPVIMMQCPYLPSERIFFHNILDVFGLTYAKTGRIDVVQEKAYGILSRLKVKVVILDEIHHVLSGSAAKQREFLNLLKHLSNELKISIIALGTHDAHYVINSDPQLASRFEKITIPKWEYNDDYFSLLATLEEIIKLKKRSLLISEKIARKIFSMTEGILGEIVHVVKLAAKFAIEDESEKITISILDQIHYTSPSKRREE